MRKLWSVIALLAVFGGLMGAYLYLEKNPLDKDKTETAAEDTIEVLKLDKTQLSKISLSSEKGEFTLEKADNKWVVSSKKELNLDESTVSNIESNLTSLNAGKLVEANASNLEEYGLKNPMAKASAVLQDGNSKTILVGNNTVDESSSYIMVKDSPQVYTVPAYVVNYLSCGLNDIRSKSLTAIDTEDIKSIKLVNANGQAIELKPNEKQTQAEKENSINNFVMTKPYVETRSVNPEKFEQLIQSIGQLKIYDFLEDSMKDASKYGLDNPRLELLVNDSKNELHLYFGNEIDGNIAFKVEGASEIYSMEKSKFEELNIPAFDLSDKIAYMPFIDNVSQISIEHGGKKDILSIAKGSDENSKVYKINDKETEESKFKDFYQVAIGLPVEAENDRTLQENSEVKIVYSLNEGAEKTKTLSFTSYNSDFYALFMNGKAEFLVSKSKVQDMLKQLEGLK